jgi:hypothetical protein
MKQEAVDLPQTGQDQDAGEAWDKFKKVRNEVNNRKKFEETNFKKVKLSESLDFHGMGQFWRATSSAL